MPEQDNNTRGRTFDQVTKDGTSSAASVGTGGTGVSNTDQGYDEAVNTPWNADSTEQGSNQPGRTDDLLSPGTAADRNGEGFSSGERPEDLLGESGNAGNRSGSGAGNRQGDDADDKVQSLSGGGRASDPTGLQTVDGNQSSASYPGEANTQSGEANQQPYGDEGTTAEAERGSS